MELELENLGDEFVELQGDEQGELQGGSTPYEELSPELQALLDSIEEVQPNEPL